MAYEALKRLPDPATTPAGPGFLSASITDNVAGLVHTLNNGSTVAVQYAGNYWTISIEYYALNRQELSSLMPFLCSVAGGFTPFYIQLPMFINPASGAWDISTATKRAEGAVSLGATDRQVVIPAWNTRGGTLAAGDMIKFTNSNKIYMVQHASLVSNVMTIDLHCPILDPTKIPTCGLEPNDIKFKVRQVGGTQSFVYQNNGLLEPFGISLTETMI